MDKVRVGRIVAVLSVFILFFTFFLSGRQSLLVQASDKSLYMKNKDYTEYFSTASRICLYISADEEDDAQKAFQEIEECWAELERKISVAVVDSDIYVFNHYLSYGQSMEISQTTYDLLTLCKRLYVETKNAYNPSVARLVDLWGFSPRFSAGSTEQQPYDREDFTKELPSEKYISAFRRLTNFETVTFEEREGKYYLTKPTETVEVDGVVYGMQLDLGGIAKGYACDLATEILNGYGFGYGYVSVGSSSMRFLQNPDKNNTLFSVKIKNPRADNTDAGDYIMASVDVKDCGMSVSGDYERYYVTHNKRYSHLISAQTGKPIETDICTACVIGGSAAENDALTTALCVMGKETATEYIKTFSDRTAFFVWENKATGKYEVITNREKDEIALNGALRHFCLCGYVQNGEFVYRPSSAVNMTEIIVAVVVAAVVIALIAGLGYRNYVLKRNTKSQDK